MAEIIQFPADLNLRKLVSLIEENFMGDLTSEDLAEVIEQFEAIYEELPNRENPSIRIDFSALPHLSDEYLRIAQDIAGNAVRESIQYVGRFAGSALGSIFRLLVENRQLQR